MISIITPLLNEEGYIEPFISHLRELQGDFELILVDGKSSYGTLEEAGRCRKGFEHRFILLEGSRGRASQMNVGAKNARGDILLFLHVDCFIPKDSLFLIERTVYQEMAAGVGFRQAFANPDTFLKLQSAIGNMRAKITGTFYGDYGIFMRKDIFEKMGGFDNVPFLEDVEICRKAKKFGRLARIDRVITTSPRRYLSKGRARLMAAFILAILFNAVGLHPGFLTEYIVDK